MNLQFKIKLISLALLFLFFNLLTKIPFTAKLDKQLSLQIFHSFNNDLIIHIFSFITNLTIGTIVGGVIVAITIFIKKGLNTGIFFVLSWIITTITFEIFKLIIQRPRPFTALTDVYSFLDGIQSDYSFPSGHTVTAFFIAYFITKIFKLNKWKTILIYSLAILVAWSRVYLGAHYILDVLAGSILGTLCGIISEEIYCRINKRN